MEIPESISNLTTDVAPSQICLPATEETVSLSKIINSIKQYTPAANYKDFEDGAVYPKQNINLDKNILKNFLSLYNDIITKAIVASEIDDNIKTELVKVFSTHIRSVITSTESLHHFINTLNKEQNIIDVLKISYIILGYAIDTIKKYTSTRG